MPQGKVICQFFKDKDFAGMTGVDEKLAAAFVDRANIVLKQKINGSDATEKDWNDFLAKYAAPHQTGVLGQDGTYGQQDMSRQANTEVGTNAQSGELISTPQGTRVQPISQSPGLHS